MDGTKLAVMLSLLVAFAVPIAGDRGKVPNIPPPLPGQICGFKGNGDLYGLGIRMGVYLQAFITTVSGAYRQKAARGIAFTNGVFQISMFIVLTYLTVTDNSLEVVEAMIIVLFSSCSISISNPEELAVSRMNESDSAGLKWFLRNLLVPFGKLMIDLALNGYMMWFWWLGIDLLQHSPCTGYGFFFSRIELFGWYRTLGKVVATLVVLLDLYLIWSVLMVRRSLPVWFTDITQPTVEKEGQFNRKLGKGLLTPRDLTVVILTWLVIIFYVFSVEFMIRWNKITGVNLLLGSVGQLIPLLVGIGSCIAVAIEWSSRPEDQAVEVAQAAQDEARTQAEAQTQTEKDNTPASAKDLESGIDEKGSRNRWWRT